VPNCTSLQAELKNIKINYLIDGVQMKLILLFVLIVCSNLVLASGENGKDAVVSDLSQSVSLNLSGSYGANGINGTDGANGYCNTSTDSVRGEDGTNGQDGEDGGNGGNAFVQFSDYSDLQNLKLISLGGSAGSGGKGGISGSGCGGANSGTDGKPGQFGHDGKHGALYLIKSPMIYTKDQSSIKIKLSELIKNETVLSENIWDKAFGPQSLLADGPEVSDEYYVLNRIFKKKIVVKWYTTSDPTTFANIDVNLKLVNEKLSINLIGYVADQTISENNEQIEISINNIFKEQEAIKLELPKFRGKDLDIRLDFIDASVLPDGIKKKYEVSVLKMGLTSAKYITLPESANQIISTNRNKTTMDLGKLAFDKKYKREGTRLLINFTISVEVNGQEKKKSFVAAYKVGKPGSSFERSYTKF
jgi:hypothetical protein